MQAVPGGNCKKSFISFCLYLLTLILALGLAVLGSIQIGYDWNWTQVPKFFFDINKMEAGPLLLGLAMTLLISITSLFLTAVLGLLVALIRLIGSPALKVIAYFYLELIRNTPLMVQLFVIYFVLGPIFDLPRFWAATLALSLFEAAYLSEIIRSGILAVNEGQWQAAWCLGLSKKQTFQHVILPQTAPMLLPPLFSLMISLVKDSALVSGIALFDLSMQTRSIVSENWSPFEFWLTAAALYLVINLGLSAIGSRLEKRYCR